MFAPEVPLTQTLASERSHTITASAANTLTPTGYGCAVAGCRSSARLDLHFGYSLCNQHITQDLVRKCTHCNQMKLLDQEHLLGLFTQTGRCMECRHLCCVSRCDRPARTIQGGWTICDWHKYRVAWCTSCEKQKYSARWINGLCEPCHNHSRTFNAAFSRTKPSERISRGTDQNEASDIRCAASI
jgi:hypothetical protein